ncbi:unnamed protein product [Miscanthus lutarioriparius]|uniref:Rx N-terminal domain-containing protein n=1 Tax=Miscanthus lutarioriparius TaxID=422564 RepID=A0A811PFI6_9POAL|nr:unnamed protein product [Miscanthus lutarioriparius]
MEQVVIDVLTKTLHSPELRCCTGSAALCQAVAVESPGRCPGSPGPGSAYDSLVFASANLPVCQPVFCLPSSTGMKGVRWNAVDKVFITSCCILKAKLLILNALRPESVLFVDKSQKESTNSHTRIQDRVMRALGVAHLQVLKGRLDYKKSVLVDPEVKRIHDSAINTWLNELKDIMYDADDLIDLCSIKSQRSSHSQLSSMLNQRDREGISHFGSGFGCVTETFDEINLLKQMIREAGGGAEQQTTRAELLQPNGILISTRHRAVLQETRSVHIHRVLKMNEDTGLELLLKDILRKQEIEKGYLFCSIFPASSQIHKDAISYWWAAEGLVSQKGSLSMHDATEGYYDELVRRNLLQLHPRYLDKSRSTMHDLLRSLSQYLSKDESMFIEARTITDSVPMLRHVGIANVGERLRAALKKIVRLRPELLMPHLKRLMLINCLKLHALPDGLSKLTSLQRIQIEGADSLEEVANLPAVVWLKVRNNRSLRRLSNLRSLERLLAQDCPALGIVKMPHSLQKVFLVDCRMEEDIRACLPQHLGILLHASTTGGDDRDMFPNESIYN